MDIRTALMRAKTLVALEPLVKDATGDVTFWGYRYIHIKGCKGILPVDALAVRVMKLVSAIDFDQNPNECEALTNMIPLITSIYDQKYARWSNPITLFLLVIRDITRDIKATGYNVDFYWDLDFVENGGFDFSEKYRLTQSIVEVCREPIGPVLDEAVDFDGLVSLASNVKEEVSFWGCRYVTVEGYDDTLSIHELAQKVMEVAKETLDYEQDQDYQELVPLIDAIYQNSDRIKAEKNLFTQLLCSIRDAWNSMETYRTQWNHHKNQT